MASWYEEPCFACLPPSRKDAAFHEPRLLLPLLLLLPLVLWLLLLLL